MAAMPAPANRPNVLLIVTDQQRYDSLGCTGDPNAVTPNLDALAAEGCVFDRHFTASPVCMPSRSSLLTGCYPATHGVWTNGIPLPRREQAPVTDQTRRVLANHWTDPAQRPPIPSHLPTMADAFAAAGHRTDAVGKLHLTPHAAHPDLRFEESDALWAAEPERMTDWHGPYFGFEHVELGGQHGTRAGGHFQQWCDRRFPGLTGRLAEEARDAGRPTELDDLYVSSVHTRASHPTTWVAEMVAGRVQRHARAGEPFFLWAGIPDPHHPFTPPAELVAEWADRPVTHRFPEPAADGEEPRWVADARAGAPRVSAEASETARRFTAAMVQLIDEAVGTMVQSLKEAGVWENTIVAFTSDHGDYLGDHGLLRKTLAPCRVLNQTPLILRGPGVTPGRCATAVSNVDVFPTLAAAAGVAVPAGVQGENLAAVRASGRRDLPVMVQTANGLPAFTSCSLLDESHRTTWHPNLDRVVSFDHRSDPAESYDLAGGGALPLPPAVAERFSMLQHAFGRSTRPSFGRVSPW